VGRGLEAGAPVSASRLIVRVLLALTFYRPNLSGLTIYVERLAKALVARGHDVTVLTSRHEPSSPRDSMEDGVRVVRAPVAFWVGKGVVMPSYGREARRLLRSHDVVSIHVPQLEAGSVALRARLAGRPAFVTYHCDLQLPPGVANRVADGLVKASNYSAAALAKGIVAYTDDYADNAALLRRFREKVAVIPPPVVMPKPDNDAVDTFVHRHGLQRADGAHRPTVGMAARLAAEKGVDVLLDALPLLERHFPDIEVLFAGPYENVVGEEAYKERLRPAIEALGLRWRFLGPLDPVREMPAFLALLDCLVVPSVNSTESFGLVQVEAMLCGTPVVASGLAGVREVVRTTGMGEVSPPGDPVALADAVARVLERRNEYVRPRGDIERLYDLSRTVEAYEELFATGVREPIPRTRPESAHE
jgi:glycosyltransferase involved in cell wall biosynthesis